MKKILAIAVLAVAGFGLGGLAAEAGVSPGIGEAAKAVAEDSKAGVVDQVHYRRHYHYRRQYAVVVPRSYSHYSYYNYRRYR